jgi:hypothetical protein
VVDLEKENAMMLEDLRALMEQNKRIKEKLEIKEKETLVIIKKSSAKAPGGSTPLRPLDPKDILAPPQPL